jgi:hypothetical protein
MRPHAPPRPGLFDAYMADLDPIGRDLFGDGSQSCAAGAHHPHPRQSLLLLGHCDKLAAVANPAGRHQGIARWSRLTSVMRSRVRPRSASSTADRMVKTSLLMPLPVTSPPRSVICRLTPLAAPVWRSQGIVQQVTLPDRRGLGEATRIILVLGAIIRRSRDRNSLPNAVAASRDRGRRGA